ncbi:MAG TPA: hypothetical protein VMU61_07615 [Candidatus Aquilonibacter sp.]|nr:hypothetical protein [Candidatus Aquilonibacter sp.]
MKAEKDEERNELCLELKYCERCGGLWLRPVGGRQMFCVRCAGEMAEPFARPQEVTYPRLPKGPTDFADDGDFEACSERFELDGGEMGGVA